MPAYVSKEWDNLRPNTELGRILLPDAVFEEVEVESGKNANEIRAAKKRKLDMEERKLGALTGAKLVLTAPQLSNCPKEHNLLFAPVPVPTFAFTENEQGNSNYVIIFTIYFTYYFVYVTLYYGFLYHSFCIVGQMNFEGKVPSRWDCKPVMTKEYRSELKLREEKEKK